MIPLSEFLTFINLRKFVDGSWVPQATYDDIDKYALYCRKAVGRGISGAVYKVKNVETGENIAAKVIYVSNDSIASAIREIKIQSILSKYPNCNKNIVSLHEVYRDNSRVIIMSEFVEGPDLYDIVPKSLSIDDAIDIMDQTLTGLKYMHDHCIAHKDIKLENIMLDKDTNTYKYIDFGLSCLITADEKSIGNYASGTPYYVSPETYWYSDKNKDDVTFDDVTRQDIWSLGVVLFLMLNGGRIPVIVDKNVGLANSMNTAKEMFSFYGVKDTMFNVEQSSYSGSTDDDINDKINEFIMSMLTINAADRPSIDYLYDHFVNHIKR